MKSSPTEGMEAILNIPPLFLYIESEAIIENYRAETSELPEIRRLADSIVKKMGEESCELLKVLLTDQMKSRIIGNKKYSIKIPDREYWKNSLLIMKEYNKIYYTDGSKTQSGVGAGIYGDSYELCFSLGNLATIFQAELVAINVCVLQLLSDDVINKNIAICSDSQAVIKALNKQETKSKLTWECYSNLSKLSERNNVTIVWVPGHSGIEGNEKLDELAKKGAEQQYIGPEPVFGLPMSSLKNSKKEWLKARSIDY